MNSAAQIKTSKISAALPVNNESDHSTAETFKVRIDCLTSLRFIAAAMIVIYHCRGQFGISPDVNLLGLPQGVSFFFVLSGFILTCVYPRLQGTSRWRFFLARFARIWPAHIAALGLALLLVLGPLSGQPGAPLVFNVAMLHSWVPLPAYYNSGNALSWSISTEFGFYVLFPLLIYQFQRTWLIKLAGAFALVVAIVCFCLWTRIPYQRTAEFSDRIVDDGLVYVNPLCRLFEFVLGMSMALLWRRLTPRYKPGKMVATLVEFSAVGLALVAIYTGSHVWWIYNTRWPGPPGWKWLADGGISCVPVGLMILTMSFQRGWISQLLSHWLAVLLGEISYSIYLVHQIIIELYRPYARSFEMVPDWAQLIGFSLIVLSTAYLLWALVERPFRRGILKLWPGNPKANASRAGGKIDAAISRPSWRSTIAAAVALVILLLGSRHITANYPKLKVIGWSEAQSIARAGPPNLRQVSFGGKFTLIGSKVSMAGNGIHLQMAWQSMGSQPLIYSNAIQVNDVHRWGIATIEEPQDIPRRIAEAGKIWETDIRIPRRLLKQAASLALIVHSGPEILQADRGSRDSNNQRLLIELPPQSP
jgi:peptidoglycan/LPS O-acetylase OafA/YrhL